MPSANGSADSGPSALADILPTFTSMNPTATTSSSNFADYNAPPQAQTVQRRVTFQEVPGVPMSATSTSRTATASPRASIDSIVTLQSDIVQQQSTSREGEPDVPRRSTSTSRRETMSSPGSERGWRRFFLKRVVTSNLTPGNKNMAPPGFYQSMKVILFGSWLNVLLIFIPLSWAFKFANTDNHTLIFAFSFLAIVPLAKLLALASDELSLRVGQTLAHLINATLGNVVEFIIAIIAIIKCQFVIVQASLVGSILSNLLLVLGMCFFAGGMRFSEQGFSLAATQVDISSLTIGVIAVLLPVAFYHAHQSGTATPSDEDTILNISRGVAIILLFIYGSYLVFQLFSHAHIYDDDNLFQSTQYPKKVDAHGNELPHTTTRLKVKKALRFRNVKDGEECGLHALPPAGDTVVRDPGTDDTEVVNLEAGDVQEIEALEEPEEVEQPNMTLMMCILLLVVVTAIIAVTAEFLVDSIDGVTAGDSGPSKTFVGLILLPIVGNAAEHVTAVSSSVKDKLNLSIGVAVGSSIQIALFVIPFMVVFAWILGKPLSLLFDPFESVTLFLAVVTVAYVVADGRSNWFEGMILMCLYAMIGVSFWFYNPSDMSTLLCPT